MKRERLLPSVAITLLLAAACTSTLNPQPLPPLEATGGVDGGGNSADASFSSSDRGDDGGLVPAVGDASASSDASTDDSGDAGDAADQ